MQDIYELGVSLSKIVDYAGIYAQRLRQDLSVEHKDDGSLVTNADRTVENWLGPQLLKLIPDVGIWGEENGFSGNTENGLWLVDPIDGTTNYIFDLPLWGISVAYFQDNEILFGAISLPDLGENYFAVKGKGAYCNGNLMSPIPHGEVTSHQPVSYSDGLMHRFPNQNWPGKMRCFGAFVADGTFFAKQRIGGLICHNIRLYDMAASVCIARELDADVVHADGGVFSEADYIKAEKITRPVMFMPKNANFVLSDNQQ